MSEEKLPVGQHEEEQTPVDPLTVSRRWLLLRVGALFNAVVGVAVAVPVVKYLLSPIKSDDAYKSWVSLGSVDIFPVGETRLAKFTNPVSRAWDGETDRVACWVHQLCPPGVPGSVVSAIGLVHVPLPRRRLLCRRKSGFRSTRARAIHLRHQDR